jgi:Site-specific DNA methylase
MSQYKTPLRYPGGKQRLWAFVDEILAENDLVAADYVEPFAGGAGVAMELLLRGRVRRVHLNDSCVGVYAFWHSLLNEPERFCRAVSRASLNIETWRHQQEIFRNRASADRFDLGFAMFYLNRCNRSGILNGGVIGGLDQTGEWKMDARFPRNELISRMEAIAARKSDIKIRNWDAERFITQYVPRLPEKTLVYCDPPYFRKADRLYPNHYKAEDHKRIAEVIQCNIKHHWIVSYDSCEEIQTFYEGRRSFEYLLQYNAAKAYKGAELFIFSDQTRIPSRSSLQTIDAALVASAF